MSWKEFLKGLQGEMSKDKITDVAGGLTYYGVLAMFPFLLFIVALASVVIAPGDAERLVEQLATVAPGAVTEILGERIRQLGEQRNVTLLGFGALGAIWAASGGMNALVRALNTAYGVEESRPFWKVRGLAVLMTLVAGGLSLVAALVAVGAAPLADRVGGPLGLAIGWLRLPVAGILMMFLWALLYWVLPDVEQRFKFITPGSVAGVVIWVLASWGFSKYVANFGSYDKTYGSLGGVIVLLLWMWISSLVLLLGAEANALIEHRSEEGKAPGAKRQEDSGRAPVGKARAEEWVAAHAEEGAAAVPAPGGGATPLAAREAARKPRLRGVAAIAAGFAAGVLVARRGAA